MFDPNFGKILIFDEIFLKKLFSILYEVIDINGVKTEIIEEVPEMVAPTKSTKPVTFTIQPKPAKQQFRLLNGTLVNGTLLPRITLAGNGTTWKTIPIQSGDGKTITLQTANIINASQVGPINFFEKFWPTLN